jgi:hypothetical protein
MRIFIKLYLSCFWRSKIAAQNDKTRLRLPATGFVFSILGAGGGPMVRASERSLAPERLAQLFVTLCFANTGISQKTRVQASQLMAAGDTALPQHQVGKYAQRHGSLGVYSIAFGEQIGTECTFHDGILPLVAALASGLTDANDPPLRPDSVDTVHLYCDGPVNCL